MQVTRVKETFGQEISRNLVVMLPDIQCLHDLDYLEQKVQIKLSIPNENLSEECWKWCKESPKFLYTYQKYSWEVVKGRWEALNRKRYTLLDVQCSHLMQYVSATFSCANLYAVGFHASNILS